MINSNRVVCVTRTNLITLYATILQIKGGLSLAKISATNPGEFVLSTGSGNKIADEPIKSLEFGSVTSMVVYFVPAFDFDGFYVGGTKKVLAGDDVVADSAQLYTATLADGTVTIAKIGL